MATQITQFSVSAPGFFGLNTADSPVDLSPNFALTATNCVIDKSGRIASRKGWKKVNSSLNTDLGSGDVECIGELIENDGTTTVLCAGNGYLFKLSGSSLTTLTYGGGGAAPTISADNWTFCQLSGVGIFWQRGYDPLIYDPAVSTTTFRRLSEKASSSGTINQCHVAISAYGRIWCADNGTDKQTVAFSDLLTPHIWTGGTSGTLNLVGVWPVGGDEITGLAAHNNFLYIFGRKQILIYSGADDPSEMKLSDTLIGIGCIARDSIQNTGEDVMFLANDGVRSLERTIQEKSAPMRTVSLNVHQDIIDYLSLGNLDDVKAGYSQQNTMYVITFGNAQTTYYFDTRNKLENGAARAAVWDQITPRSYCEANDGTFYLGQAGYLGEYSGYYDNASTYRIGYFTTWLDFGAPVRTSILKKIMITLLGLTNQTLVFKWGFDYEGDYTSQSATLTGISDPAEYGIAEYGIAEYSGGGAFARTVSLNASGSGKVLQFGVEALVGGYPIAIQRIDIYTKEGRLPA
jgi:hypothetical protein